MESNRVARLGSQLGNTCPHAAGTNDGNNAAGIQDIRHRDLRVCRRDDRLARGVRDRRFWYPVELLVRRYQLSPAVQIIRVFEVGKDGLYELDYWCDVCAIAMYELKDCECCQGPIELRRTKVK